MTDKQADDGEGERHRFTTRVDNTSGQKFIVSPRGKDVIQYWNINFGRLSNLREFNAEFVDGGTIICRHGGALRTLLSYLNDGKWLNDYDEYDLYNADVKVRLDKMRLDQCQR